MTLMIDRRSLLLTGTLGVAAFAVPGFAQTSTIADARGFTHAVASGEPASDSMLLWTRYVPAADGPVELKAEISETADFARVVSGGAAITGPWRDHTVKITVENLRPATNYYYRFVAPDGTRSPVGRTRTLAADGLRTFRAAVFSCSNMPFGWFNAYGHAVARGDLDAWIHLGDYFYEYAVNGDYPPPNVAVPGRKPLPGNATVSLADYRLRYASYRADPDLQALHRYVPMIAQWDDHESANDSWEGGAEHHDPATEGDWNARRAASIQAYREWMPVSDEPWKAYDIGQLATLFRTETRLLARTHQDDVDALFKANDPATALRRFRDGAWMDPGMTMMGSQQEDWLTHAMRRSVRQGQHWQVVGFGTIMGQTYMPAAAESWIDPSSSKRARSYTENGVMAGKLGLPFNYDNWGGYPAARARFLKSAQADATNLILLSGDSHNAWAYDLGQDGHPAGVEFAGHSVTSPGIESGTRHDPKRVAADLVAASPELKWCDTSRRGYMVTTIGPDRVDNDWVFVDTIKLHRLKAAVGHSATVQRGRNVMA